MDRVSTADRSRKSTSGSDRERVRDGSGLLVLLPEEIYTGKRGTSVDLKVTSV